MGYLDALRCGVGRTSRACQMGLCTEINLGVEGVHRCPWQMSSRSVRSSLRARSGVEPRAGVCAAVGQREVDAGLLDDLMARVDEDRLALRTAARAGDRASPYLSRSRRCWNLAWSRS